MTARRLLQFPYLAYWASLLGIVHAFVDPTFWWGGPWGGVVFWVIASALAWSVDIMGGVRNWIAVGKREALERKQRNSELQRASRSWWWRLVEMIAVAGGALVGYALGSGRFAVTLASGLSAAFVTHLVLRRVVDRRLRGVADRGGSAESDEQTADTRKNHGGE